MMFLGYKCNFMFEKRNTTGRMQCIYTCASDPGLYQCNSGNSMSFLDIKDPAKRMALVDEYVKAMNTDHNMVNRKMRLAIGEELQTLFHPIVSATKQAAEKTAEELVPVKKALEDIDGALKAEHRTLPPQKDLTFGIHLGMDRMQWGQHNAYRRKYFEGR